MLTSPHDISKENTAFSCVIQMAGFFNHEIRKIQKANIAFVPFNISIDFVCVERRADLEKFTFLNCFAKIQRKGCFTIKSDFGFIAGKVHNIGSF